MKSFAMTAVCQAGQSHGLGHLTRTLALTNEFGTGSITVIVVGDDALEDRLSFDSEKNAKVVWVRNQGELSALLTRSKPDCLVLDAADLDSVRLVQLAAPGLTVLLSPLLDTPMTPTIHVHRGSKLPERWDRRRDCEYALGIEFAVVPPQVGRHRTRAPRASHFAANDEDGSITLGLAAGARPSTQTLQVFASILSALHNLSPSPRVLISGLDDGSLTGRLGSVGIDANRLSFVPEQDPWSVLTSAHLVVTSGGQSLIEAAALGVPSVAVPRLPMQFEVAELLASRGACVVISGEACRLNEEIEHVLPWISQIVARSESGIRLEPWIDDLGAWRIAQLILDCVQMERNEMCYR